MAFVRGCKDCAERVGNQTHYGKPTSKQQQGGEFYLNFFLGAQGSISIRAWTKQGYFFIGGGYIFLFRLLQKGFQSFFISPDDFLPCDFPPPAGS